uniref:Uncharacterized protein n=1 Tax=Physcomitrium patens TaxID=3218 RepID=A0A2K1L3S4_PHYPA|nr:hypothetical protein PHYPA_003469 [Physcomitrium patens]
MPSDVFLRMRSWIQTNSTSLYYLNRVPSGHRSFMYMVIQSVSYWGRFSYAARFNTQLGHVLCSTHPLMQMHTSK